MLWTQTTNILLSISHIIEASHIQVMVMKFCKTEFSKKVVRHRPTSRGRLAKVGECSVDVVVSLSFQIGHLSCSHCIFMAFLSHALNSPALRNDKPYFYVVVTNPNACCFIHLFNRYIWILSKNIRLSHFQGMQIVLLVEDIYPEPYKSTINK